MAYSSVTSLNVELWSGIHNWLGDSVGSNLILNTCYTTEKKDMLVSTRGKKSDWTAAKEDGFAFSAQLQTDRSFSQGTERKKNKQGEKKKISKGKAGEREIRAAMKSYPFTPQVLWEAKVRKEIISVYHDLYPLGNLHL